MSDSIPKKTPDRTKQTGALRARLARIPAWWLMSAAFHAILLTWLALFSPVRIIDLRKNNAEFTAGSERIREVMDQVRERQADILTFDVRTLQDIQQELSELEGRKWAEFEKFSTEFAQDAPTLAEEAQQAAAKAQEEALAAQQQTKPTLQNFNPADTNAISTLRTQQKGVEAAQDRVSQPQEKAVQALAMSDAHYDGARLAQAEANALQQRASKTQLDANALQDDAKWINEHFRSKEREVERATESRQQAEGKVAEAQTNLTTAQTNWVQAGVESTNLLAAAAEAKGKYETAKTEADRARSDYDKLPAKDPNKKAMKDASALAQTAASDARKQADQAQNKANEGRRKVESAQRKVESARNESQRSQDRLKEQLTRLERLQAETTQARTNAEAHNSKLLQTQLAANKLQDDAHQAQLKARQALALARQTASTNMLASLTNTFTLPTNSQPMPDVYGMNLADLYQTAVGTEDRLTESYKRIRATELAMLRKIPLSRAMALTDVAKVVRPNLKAELQKSVTAGEEVAGAREAVQTAASEINAMVTLGTSLLEQAKGLDHSGSASDQGAGISLDWVNAQAAQMETMEGLAAEDSDQRAKDLSGAMQAGKDGAGDGNGQAGNGGAGRPGVGAGRMNAGGLAGLPGRRPGFGAGGPPAFPKKLNALPGRKVKGSAMPSEWMYIDSWYIIGPWDNARRENIEKKFPPETVVDLNAAYVGKDNQTIRWDFYQSGNAAVRAPFDHYLSEKKRLNYDEDLRTRNLEYIIYYAYTELYFEQACDLWIAIGSDDYSKVWVEDQLVWASGKLQKSWRVDEGLRKVHFKAGLNRILYRVENGWHTTEFSLVICLR